MTLNITLPRSWADLSQKQLRIALATVFNDHLSPFDARLLLALRFAGLRKLPGHTDAFRLRSKGQPTQFMILLDQELQALADAMRFITAPPESPVRPDHIDGARAIDPMLEALDFESFLAADCLYQGFVNAVDKKASVDLLARLSFYLWPSRLPERILLRRRLKGWRPAAALMWFSAAKAGLARRYPNFLRPAAAGQPSFGQSMRSAVDAQLRALTRGDLTKEQAIRHTPCHRALAELDALAAEAEDLRKRLNR